MMILLFFDILVKFYVVNHPLFDKQLSLSVIELRIITNASNETTQVINVVDLIKQEWFIIYVLGILSINTNLIIHLYVVVSYQSILI